ncbi:MAG: MFS transporter [Pseudomonadota bacterium]
MASLSHSTRLSFGIGQLAEGIKNTSFGAFLLFYYNQVLGLSGELAGAAIAISLIFDAITDPLVGSISDRWSGPRGRRHPFMYASALPLALSFCFLFAPLDSVKEGDQLWLFVWMLCLTVLNRTAMTLYHVPHLALGAELSEDYHERTILVAIRQFLSTTGQLLVFGLGFGWFFAPTDVFKNGQLNADAYPPFAVTLALVMCASIWVSAWGTRRCIPSLPGPTDHQRNASVKQMLGDCFKAMNSKSFVSLMLGYTVIVVVYGVASAGTLYMFTFFWELPRFHMLIVLVSGSAGGLLGYSLASRLFTHFEKRDAMILGGSIWMVCHSLPVICFSLDFVPSNGTWLLTTFLATIYLCAGCSIAQVIVGASSTMADIADESELSVGGRQEGVLFGAASFAGKCTTALGSLITGILLKAIEWPVGENVKTAADIAPDTILKMGVALGPAVALLAIPGFWFLTRYDLNRLRVAEIQEKLRERA